MIRFFDIVISFFSLLILSPLLIIIAIWILLDSGWPILFRQTRVGKHGHHFVLFKFRSMTVAAESKGQLTVGADARITNAGRALRSSKLDELPQLWNVLKGEMSLVGPRPEVPKYVAQYSEGQLKVLNVQPGITDFASIEYRDENELLASAKDPEKKYLEEILPQKLELSMKYVNRRNAANYFRIIWLTIRKVFF